jgi:hypothetical protein
VGEAPALVFADGLVLPPPVEQALTIRASVDAPRASMRNLRIGSSFFRCSGVFAVVRGARWRSVSARL